MSPFVFGPVPSRRLGRSLGIDLVPLKTCTYDCIYCQLGRTTNKTTQLKQWHPLADIINELKGKLTASPDYITLAGSGEPTLYEPIDELITQIKQITNIPVAVLTNGSLLSSSNVRKGIFKADLVIPSLDAGNEQTFQKVNQPHHDITFQNMLHGLIKCRKEFTGQYWLEVFILQDITTAEKEITDLARCVKQIKPDRVQINTVTRPPAESNALAVHKEKLQQIARQISKNAEVIADYHQVHKQQNFAAKQNDVLDLLKRRPCSIDDIAQGLAMHRNEVLKYIEELAEKRIITLETRNGQIYHKVKSL